MSEILSIGLPALSVTGSAGIISAALALGFRHGIDWDHIAAITDITSTASDGASVEDEEQWLMREPGLMLTDESHHTLAHGSKAATASGAVLVGDDVRQAAGAGLPPYLHSHEPTNGHGPAQNGHRNGVSAFVERQRPALVLGTMYAIGHGSVVFALGLLAILARGVLPDWIDPIMERIVGVTLVFLAVYLFYSLFRFFRGQGEFKMRSRWMIVFAGVRNVYERVRAKVFGRPRQHVHTSQSYGVRTAVGIGMIHGVGAETGTQALVIATAVGADNQVLGVVALCAFLVGLLISNSMVTVISSMGFVSSRQRQWVYVGAGLFAAVFSLLVGIFFILRSADALPDLQHYFGWLGGGS
jgi:high-affinity nickel-transport protein